MKIMPLETRMFKQEFVCVDSDTAIIEKALHEYHVPVKYDVYVKPGLKRYRVLYLCFNKKYTATIIGILGTLKNKFLLTGFTDYDDVSSDILHSIFKKSDETEYLDVPDSVLEISM